MKLTKKISAEVQKAYYGMWEAYFKGDMKTFSSFLHKDFQMTGTAEKEVFRTKRAALKFYTSTASQVAGVAQLRNRDIRLIPVENNIMILEQADLYVLMNKKWRLYGSLRLSTLFTQAEGKWQSLHQHGSFPDSRAGEGEQLSTEKIRQENLQLREAVKRRTLELEQKNRDLEIESSLERVRTVAMGMNKRDDVLNVCRVMYHELQALGFRDLRNCLINFWDDSQKKLLDYDYSDFAGANISRLAYSDHPVFEKFLKKLRRSKDAFARLDIKKDELAGWIKRRRKDGEYEDSRLRKINALYYYFYSIGAGALGLSVLKPLPAEHVILLKRFRNVFDLAYQRYQDIEKAEAQAREVQIQLMLEKVRARSMAMHHSDELADVIKLIYREFDKLKISNESSDIEIGIIDEETGIADVWAHLYLSEGTISRFKFPLNHFPLICDEYSKWKSTAFENRKELFFTTEFSKEDLKKFSGLGDEFSELEEILRPLVEAKFKKWVTHNAYFSHGLLTLQGEDHYPPGTLEIQQRLAIVFEQTYIRFLDLQKAEAQAREAKIQLALERVRARTMAMHRSEELSETSFVLFGQLKELGEDSDQTNIGIFDDDNTAMTLYATTHGSQWTRGARIELTKHRVYQQLHSAWKNNLKSIVIDIGGKELESLNKFKLENPDYQVWSVEDLPKDRWMIYNAFFSKGTIAVCTTKPFPDESIQLFERFAQVFDLTYRRFLDLKNAEAQTRESQIQLALERVRARTMAMQKSDELPEAANLLFQQVQSLGMPTWSAGYCIWDEDKKAITLSMSRPFGDIQPPFRVPLNENPTFIHYLEAHKKGLELYIKEIDGEALEETYQYLRSLPVVGEQLNAIIAEGHPLPTFEVDHCAYFSKGFLLFITHEQVPESHDIFKRFANVFDQTYTRFLDLQKAEAQAREAEIQLALERVRAKSMAMQTSNEVNDVISVLFKQFDVLGLNPRFAHLSLYNENGIATVRMTDTSGERVMAEADVPLDSYPEWKESFEQWKKAEQNSVQIMKYPPEVLPYVFGLMQDVLDKMPEEHRIDPYGFPNGMVTVQGHCRFGYLGMNIEGDPTEEEKSIVARFASEFGQVYNRFLDLQKSETQAREAQIQLALERVRARTMAMYKSDELPETSHVLFEQMKELGEPVEQLTIGIIDEENHVVEISATLLGDTLKKIYRHSIDEPYMMNKVYKAWKKQQKTLVVELRGDEVNAYNKYRNELTKSEMFPTNFGEEYRRIVYAAFFSKGMLALGANEPRPSQSIQLLERFASVFDLTYTRFLDLQRAEAQAREAMIEAALERVRSRSLAMQSSEELQDVLSVLFQQYDVLGIHPVNVFLTLFEFDKDRFIYRASGKGGVRAIGQQIVHFSASPIWQEVIEKFKNEKSSATELIHYPKESLPGIFEIFHEAFTAVPAEYQIRPEDFPHGIYTTHGHNEFGYLGVNHTRPCTEEEEEIIARFAKEFGRVYQRFLDLQKAEAQAREAQIEAALERVRSRTMGMQRSEEIADIVGRIFAELKQLDLVLNRVLIWTFNDKERYISWWSANPETESNAESYRIDYNDQPVFLSYLKAWQERYPLHLYTLSGENKRKWEDHLFTHTELSKIPEAVRKGMREEGTIFTTSTVSDYGLMMVGSYEPLSEENINIIQRFGKIFQQSYTRYLDVQKAEAQAREAQIEAALERVRSRSIGMQKSEELKEVIQVVIEQFVLLNIQVDHAGFVVDYQPKGNWNFWIADKHAVISRISVPWYDNVWGRQFENAKEKDENFFATHLNFEEKNKFYQDLLALTPDIPDEAWEFYLTCPGLAISTVLMDNVALYIENFEGNTYTEEDNAILLRFGKVFQQTYTRFLDLQKTEAQAREAQIQLALERVRARTMAMQRSEELSETSFVLFQQLKELGEESDQTSIGILYEDEPVIKLYSTTYGSQWTRGARIELNKHSVYQQMHSAWKNKQKALVIDVSGKELEDLNKSKLENPDYQVFVDDLPKDRWMIYCAFFSNGLIGLASTKPHPDESIRLLERFAQVFEHTYTRFLDLQKAEAQAKEAQIEAALERVRSRTMAIQRSEEIAHIVGKIFAELKQLDFELNRVLIWTFNDREKYINWWSANPETETTAESYRIEYNDHPVFLSVLQAWKEKNPLHLFTLTGKPKKSWEDFLFTRTGLSKLPVAVVKGMREENRIHTTSVISDYGLLMVGSYEPLSEPNIEIIQRFGRVFQQSYTRYLDVQHAETQAREAQIELGLERVRARAMAMQNSDELGELVAILFKELTRLDLVLARCIIWIFDNDTLSARLWMANAEDKETAKSYYVKRLDHPYYDSIVKGWKEKSTNWIYDLKGHDKQTIDQMLLNETELSRLPEAVKQGILGSSETFVAGSFNNFGLLEASGPEKPSDEQLDILNRFGKVFDLSYTRFNDLKMAEARAREAKIEAGLERVRSASLSMESTNDLQKVVDIVFVELNKLDIGMDHTAIVTLIEGSKDYDVWVGSADANFTTVSRIPYNSLTQVQRDYNEMIENRPSVLSKEYNGEIKREYSRYLFSQTGFKNNTPEKELRLMMDGDSLITSIVMLQNTGIQIVSYREHRFSEDDEKILSRFSNVFEQAYIRFTDIKRSEEQARESQIQLALERVRARTLAMQNSEELAETAAVLFRQLIHLGIEPNRLYIAIIKDKSTEAEFWITDEEGSKISSPYTADLDQNVSFRKMYDGWKAQKESLVIDLQGRELQDYLAHLTRLDVSFRGGLSQKRRIQYLAYFSKGFIGMASMEEQPAETLHLLERFAGAFNLTFIRFNDLKVAEAHAVKAEQDLLEIKAARKHAEEALAELQAMQKQLIQSEKMASLGELTAGIAHEIQNPLNFVNNFSEVSNELIEEMKEELAKGNIQLANELLEDIKQNLEKINHHGNRADGIVKGMLQHSRSSSGQKEMVDINVLADEYLRLAYHGLRAKDKSFNAKFETHFDSAIEKISIVPQEMGRVILNLINNAFYAVSEKAKQNISGYEPTVTVKTSNTPPFGGRGAAIEICVKDNGNGIPDFIKEKIFQPFFSTKPTGQGTGLGLSLSYDIVKAHGGELKVETAVGEGSEFVIQLPV